MLSVILAVAMAVFGGGVMSTHAVAPDSTHAVAPDSTHAVAPDSTHAVAPD